MNRPTDSILRRFSRVVDSSLTTFFGAIAERVAVRPYTVIAVMTILSLLGGAGMIRIKVVTDDEKLYTPQGTQGFADQVNSGPLISIIFFSSVRTLLTLPCWLEYHSEYLGNVI